MEATPSVVWQRVAALGFSIESTAPAVLEGARRLFAPWILEDSPVAIVRRWHVEADGTGKYGVTEVGEDYFAESDVRL